MNLNPGGIYHVYNRGNNRKRLFYDEWNYPFFLEKIRKYISPYCDILGYSLMPNHFHFLIYANEETIQPWAPYDDLEYVSIDRNSIHMSMFSRGIQMLLSSYAKAINHQHNRCGSLFTQNTHAKQTSNELLLLDYSLWCFVYIHNNPVISGLVSSPEKWKYSSYREYQGMVKEPLCNLELGRKLLSLNINQLSSFDSLEVPDFAIAKFF